MPKTKKKSAQRRAKEVRSVVSQKRKSDTFRQEEKQKRKKRTPEPKTCNQNIQSFLKGCKEGPTCICESCGGLWFCNNVKIFNMKFFNENQQTALKGSFCHGELIL